MISELNQPARIASLECELVKIPCLPEVFVSNVGAARMKFHRSFAWRPTRDILFCLFSRNFPRRYARSKNPPVAFWQTRRC